MTTNAPAQLHRPLLRTECLELLAGTSLGRVAMSDRALPIIVPAAYRLVDEAIELEATGPMLTNAGANGHVVCFEAGSSDADDGWSVNVIGKLLASLPAGRVPTLRLATTMMSGRRWSQREQREAAHSGTSDPGW